MRYRGEIDGLRAVAVLPVIFFHADFHLFSGGFVGVDVFFVISGYLITSIILSDLERGSFNILEFYERRARRILPALFVMMAVCSVFAWRWLLPQDLKGYAQSLVAVSTFASNILFWKTSNYFDTATELKPLLHTWSLAVEEQYYVIFPLLLLLAWRFGKPRIVALLAVLAAASLLVAQWGASAAPTANFYLLPSRGWELIAGAFVAFYFSSQNRVQASQSLRELGGWTGLLLIAYAIFAFDSRTPFPSLYTLVPVAGAVLIILFADANTRIGQVLGARPLRGIGMISYSAYLWHQPMLAFARYRMPSPPDHLQFAGLVAVSLALAYLSWKYVETPFRQKGLSRKTVLSYAGIGCMVFAAAGMAGHLNKGYASRFPGIQDLLAIKTVDNSECHLARRTAEQIRRGDICKVGTDPNPSLAVVGDSHAGALFESLGKYPASAPLSFYAISGGFCAPLQHFRFIGNLVDCEEVTTAAFQRIIDTPTITTVVMFAEWANYTKGNRDDGNGKIPPAGVVADDIGAAATPAENQVVFERSLRRTVENLQRAGKRVLIIKPVPEFHQRVFDSVAKQTVYTAARASYPSISLSDYSERNEEVLSVFSRLAGVEFVDPTGLFCSESVCSSADAKKRILFSDTNHVNEHGGDLIAAELMQRLLEGPGSRANASTTVATGPAGRTK
jgi:peptidoglycan/LPS O-acetylase OafA/YrhL